MSLVVKELLSLLTEIVCRFTKFITPRAPSFLVLWIDEFWEVVDIMVNIVRVWISSNSSLDHLRSRKGNFSAVIA